MTKDSPNPRSKSILAASAVASVGLHALVFLGLSQVEGAPSQLPRSAASRLDALAWTASSDRVVPLQPVPEPEPKPEPKPEPEPRVEPEPAPPVPAPEGRLGIEESNQDTKNWLGVADPTEHRAPQFDTEQPSWSPEPGVPVPPGNAPNAGTPAPSAAAESGPAKESVKGDANSAPADEAPTASEQQESATEAALGSEAREATTTPSEGPMPLPAAAETTRGAPEGVDASEAMDAARVAPSDAPEVDRPAVSDEASLDAARAPMPDVADDAPIGERAQEAHKGDSEATIQGEGLVATNEAAEDAAPVKFSSQEMAPLAEQAALLAPLPFTPPMAVKVSDAVREALRVATRQGQTDAKEQARDAAARESSTSPMAAAPGGQAGAPVPPGARPAEVSEADTSPTSRIPAIDVKLGRPAAGQGLEVITVRPRFSVTTTLTTMPQRSSIDVVFGRDGTVLKAAFLEGKTTGYADVDGPLLDAVYRWRAKGKALLDLPAGRDPSKGLVVTFHIEL